MLASLPMYDWPEIRGATDAFWTGLVRHAGGVGMLDRAAGHDALWRQPTLHFSQTCGYPFTHEFRDLLHYLATPHYLADGCEGANYSSLIFARDDLPLSAMQGWIPAINSPDSLSGMLALKLAFPAQARTGDFFAPALLTGSHLNSLKAVREGKADICAIDAVCVALAQKHRPQDLNGLVEIARSPLLPGLPYVTRAGDVKLWRFAILKTFADPSLAKARADLLLGGISVLPEGAYDKILELEAKL